MSLPATAYLKATTAAAVAALGAAETALADGRFTAAEGVRVAIVFVAALGFVWAVPNTSSASVSVDGALSQEPSTGASDVVVPRTRRRGGSGRLTTEVTAPSD